MRPTYGQWRVCGHENKFGFPLALSGLWVKVWAFDLNERLVVRLLPQTPLGNCRLDITLDENPDHSESLGNGVLTVRREAVIRFGKPEMDCYSEAEQLSENDFVNVNNTDDYIVILWGMSQVNESFEVTYFGDSPYWFFHDMVHAIDDVEEGEIYVDDFREERALVNGAILALDMGCELSDIVRQLVKAEPLFASRFEYETETLTKFLNGIKSWITTNEPVSSS